jgi:hypothetical protein
LAAQVTGCVTFYDGEDRQVKPTLNSRREPLSVGPLTVKQPSGYATLGISDKPEDLARMRDALTQTLEESGRFTSVVQSEKPKKESLHLGWTLEVKPHPHRVWEFFSNLTLAIIPYREEVTFTSHFTVLDAQGGIVGKYNVSDDEVVWMQLLLAFAAPFNTEGWPSDELIEGHANYLMNVLAKDQSSES